MSEKDTLNDVARKEWKQSGLTYEDIGSKELYALIPFLKEELAKRKEFPMRLSKKVYMKINDTGTIKEAYLYVNGSYFKRREAISFNTDGFIGFCGWADTANTRPFTNAFSRWIDYLKGETR